MLVVRPIVVNKHRLSLSHALALLRLAPSRLQSGLSLVSQQYFRPVLLSFPGDSLVGIVITGSKLIRVEVLKELLLLRRELAPHGLRLLVQQL